MKGWIAGLKGGLVNDWARARVLASHTWSAQGIGGKFRRGAYSLHNFATAGDISRRLEPVMKELKGKELESVQAAISRASMRRSLAVGAIGMAGGYAGLDLTRRAFTDPNTGRFNLPGIPFF